MFLNSHKISSKLQLNVQQYFILFKPFVMDTFLWIS